ncbi:hypothetical protein APHAL10511_000493 [Amanita phalloides]|nr:hypothetical protein APHAL10511_000493 [Amanita phalloides]
MQRDSRLLTPYYAPNSAFQTQPVHSDFGDKKGKRRARETNGRHSSASVYTNAHSFLSNSHPNVVLSDDEASVILPGAVTQRRVIPPKEVTASNTPFPRTPGDTDIAPGSGSGSAGGPSGFDVNASMMPYSVAALYIGEYLNGYGDGFSTVASGLDPNGQPAPSAGRIEPSGQHGWGGTAQDATPRTSWRREIAASPSQSGSQQHYTGHGSSARPSAAEQGNDSSEERLVYHVNGPRERLGTTSSNASNVDSDSNYADGHVTDSSFHSKSRNNANEGPSQFRARQHRRRAPIPPGHETDVESARRTRDDYRVPPTLRPSSVSVSSWSIHPPAATTAATIAVGQASMTRSQNELGLTSFGPASMYPSPPQDTPRSTLSVLGLHSFPLREDDEIVMERLPSVSASVGHGPSTPTTQQPRQRGERRVSFDHRPTIIVGAGASVQSLGQGQATTATSAVSAIATTAMASMSVNESSSSSRNLQRRSGRQGYPHGRSNTSASARSSSASVQSNTMHPPPMILDTTIAMEDAVHLAAAEMPRPLPRTPPRLRNALGLQLEDNTTGASGGISAPTPIVSAETFLRSWSNGE